MHLCQREKAHSTFSFAYFQVQTLTKTDERSEAESSST